MDCVVRVTAPQDAVEPPALLGNRQLSSISQLLADGFQLGFLSLGDTPAAYRKRSGFRLGAEVGEPEEVKRPRNERPSYQTPSLFEIGSHVRATETRALAKQ